VPLKFEKLKVLSYASYIACLDSQSDLKSEYEKEKEKEKVIKIW